MLHQIGGIFVHLISILASKRPNSRSARPIHCTNLDLMVAMENIYVNFKRILLEQRKSTTNNNIYSNWTRTHNHLVLKRTLNHLAKLAKWSSCVLSTYLYGAFDCMFLSCHHFLAYFTPLTSKLKMRISWS